MSAAKYVGRPGTTRSRGAFASSDHVGPATYTADRTRRNADTPDRTRHPDRPKRELQRTHGQLLDWNPATLGEGGIKERVTCIHIRDEPHPLTMPKPEQEPPLHEPLALSPDRALSSGPGGGCHGECHVLSAGRAVGAIRAGALTGFASPGGSVCQERRRIRGGRTDPLSSLLGSALVRRPRAVRAKPLRRAGGGWLLGGEREVRDVRERGREVLHR